MKSLGTRQAIRRAIVVGMSALALLAAMAVGPLGAAAAAPYVYGCAPATFYFTTADYYVSLTIYNGTATTANLTHKILAGNGAALNAIIVGAPATTSILPPTLTRTAVWFTTHGNPSEFNAIVPASIRIVSNVPVVATYSHQMTAGDWKPIMCMPEQP